MDNSPLGKLPPELRNNIYELALTSRTAIKIRRGDNCKLFARTSTHLWSLEVSVSQSKLLSLPKCCKVLRQESLPVLFACNKFQIRLDAQGLDLFGSMDFSSVLHQFIDTLGESNSRLLRDVCCAVDRVPNYILRSPFKDKKAIIETFRPLCAWHAANPHWHLKLILQLEYVNYREWEDMMVETRFESEIALGDLGTAAETWKIEFEKWCVRHRYEVRGNGPEEMPAFFEQLCKELGKGGRRSLRRKA